MKFIDYLLIIMSGLIMFGAMAESLGGQTEKAIFAGIVSCWFLLLSMIND